MLGDDVQVLDISRGVLQPSPGFCKGDQRERVQVNKPLLWDTPIVKTFFPYGNRMFCFIQPLREICPMSIGDNSIMKKDELHKAIDAAVKNHANSMSELQQVATQAVLHAVTHGDTVFGCRILNGLKGRVGDDFQKWFEDHAGCKWESPVFKMVKGQAQEKDINKLLTTPFYLYKRVPIDKAYDLVKACSNLAKALVNEKKAPYINGADSNQQDAVFQLIASFRTAGFTVDPSFDSTVTKDAVSF